MNIQKYDIYRFPMKYEEDFMEENPRTKDRPCIVKEVNDDTIVVMAMITSQQHKNQYTIRDWKQAGLNKPSYINYKHDEITTVDRLGEYIGHLSDYDIQRIKSQKWDESLDIYNDDIFTEEI